MQSIDRLPPGNISVASQQELVGALHGRITAYGSQPVEKRMLVTDRRGEQSMVDQHVLQPLWDLSTDPAVEHILLQAGSRFYGSGPDGAVLAVDHPVGQEAAQVTQIGTVAGRPWTMLAAEGRLFVVTEEGRIYCFSKRKSSRVHKEPETGLKDARQPRTKQGDRATLLQGFGGLRGGDRVPGRPVS